MKTLNLTMLQVVRVALMLDAHPGQRKDLRIVRDVRERLGISDEKLASLLKPAPGQNGLIISDEIREMDPITLQLAPEEARKLLEILDGQTLVMRDLVWAEPLGKDLMSITG